ncbi:hypothetical protein BGX21_007793, partial [Mortierella sp. AD011]
MPRNTPPYNSFPPCTYCNRTGHRPERCYTKYPHLRPGYNSPSDHPQAERVNALRSGWGATTKPQNYKGNDWYTLSIEFNGNSTEVLVDTGARMSCISAEFCATASLTSSLNTKYRTPVRVADGRIRQTLGSVIIIINNTPFSFQ